MSLFEQFSIPNNRQERNKTAPMGVTLARVTNLVDPLDLGRVGCQFISAREDTNKNLNWAYVMTPFGGNGSGFFFMPNLDDVVLVVFEEGDIHRPYIIGSLWISTTGTTEEPPIAPPLKITDGKYETYLIKTPNQSSIEFADKKGEETITVKTPKERKVVLNDKEKLIELSDGDNSISMDGNSGEVKIKCKSKLTIEVGSAAKISIDGMAGTVKIEGQQSIDIEAAQVNITAKANATIKGNAQVTVEGGGMTIVKGGILKLN
ncbi:MAG: hypothetical protein APF81_15375 [Desulfosporosinus sp. BRH_c37]|nr:MAG: hypothetical protein APF81_15375 [Desulfosporosinus sp. BRH_c37]